MFHLKKEVWEHVRDQGLQSQQEMQDNSDKNDFAYLDLCQKADEMYRRNGNVPVHKWTRIKDMQDVLRPLCGIGEKLPTNKAETLKCVHEWIDRPRRVIEADIIERFFLSKNEGNETDKLDKECKIDSKAIIEDERLTLIKMWKITKIMH